MQSIQLLDNNTDDSRHEIQAVINEFSFPVPLVFHTYKHKDPSRTHVWSMNYIVHQAQTSWVFVTRADYLLAFNTLERFSAECDQRSHDWNGFVTGWGSHVYLDIEQCEQKLWRQHGPNVLPCGELYKYTEVDTGVWLGRRDAFHNVGGLDERLTAWGHAQTHFQWKLHRSGVEFVQIQDVLFYHPHHGGDKDLDLAHRQIAEIGVDLKQMWERYPGVY